jgi:hypothetical protein
MIRPGRRISGAGLHVVIDAKAKLASPALSNGSVSTRYTSIWWKRLIVHEERQNAQRVSIAAELFSIDTRIHGGFPLHPGQRSRERWLEEQRTYAAQRGRRLASMTYDPTPAANAVSRVIPGRYHRSSASFHTSPTKCMPERSGRTWTALTTNGESVALKRQQSLYALVL